MRLPGWPFLQQLSQGANPSASPQSFGLLLLILYLSRSSPKAPSPGGPPGPTGEREPSAAAQVACGMRGRTQSVSPVDSLSASWECAVHLVSASLSICQGEHIEGDSPTAGTRRFVGSRGASQPPAQLPVGRGPIRMQD